MSEHVKLTLRRCDDWDWYVMDREEHDGAEWFERTGPNVMSLRCSSRLGDADVEGTADEWRYMAEAIEKGDCAHFRRCAAETNADGSVTLYSPRNSQDTPSIDRESAAYLAAEIRRVLTEATATALLPDDNGGAA